MLEETEDGRYHDVWINNDSPDIEFIEIDDNGDETSIAAILLSIFDPEEVPVFGIFDVESIDYLIDSLVEARETLREMKDNESY